MQFTINDSTLGLVLVAEGAAGICAVLLGDDAGALRADLRRRFPAAELAEGDNDAKARAAQVVRRVESPASDGALEALPLDPHGTAFQLAVWSALRNIPAGTTVSYGALAERVGRVTSLRAVARACGANPLAVLVPCHRAVRSNGTLAGYRWGLERKRALLARERETEAGAHRSAPPL